jgi:hypothetical protein
MGLSELSAEFDMHEYKKRRLASHSRSPSPSGQVSHAGDEEGKAKS